MKIKKFFQEFKVLSSADVGIYEEVNYVLICFMEGAKILSLFYWKKFRARNF
jgi:hypothetical protein